MMENKRKLHVGCGDIYLDGWINIDIRKDVKADIYDDINKLDKIQDNSIDVLYSCHNLEHFGFNCVRPSFLDVLNVWIKKIRIGGKLYLSVPNLRNIGKALFFSRDIRKHKAFIKAIYGGCEYPTNRHFMGFTKELLYDILKEVGMQKIQKFEPFVNDTSKFVLYGCFCSINVVATKPQGWSDDLLKDFRV